MKTLRHLLLDCRTALRRADPAFEQSALRQRLDDTIIAMSAAPAAPQDELRVPETRAAQQVAYAWQVATRDLRFSHPELHAELGGRVRRLLDAEVLDDPAFEIQRLQAANAAANASTAAAAAELAELRQALADAVPTVHNGMPPAEAARLRLRALIETGSRGGSLPKAPPPADPAAIVLTRADLLAVVAGERTLSRDERDWCVGEAMVLSGFQHNPTQLLAQGEAALVRIILDAAVP